LFYVVSQNRRGCNATRGKAPVKTGMELRMKEPYEKGLAIRLGHELCGGEGDFAAEALVVVRVGKVWSSEMLNRRADRLLLLGRQHDVRR